MFGTSERQKKQQTWDLELEPASGLQAKRQHHEAVYAILLEAAPRRCTGASTSTGPWRHRDPRSLEHGTRQRNVGTVLLAKRCTMGMILVLWLP
jgi:hypothetical protein